MKTIMAQEPAVRSPDAASPSQDLFVLMRGMKCILSSNLIAISRSVASGLLEVVHPGETMESPIELLISHLQPFSLPEHLDADARRTCPEAVGILQFSIETAFDTTRNPFAKVSGQWACEVDEEFIRLVRARQPAALAVLSYYCIVLHLAKQTH